MVTFGSDMSRGYFHEMDREYVIHDQGAGHDHAHGHDHGHSHGESSTGDVGIGMGELGMSGGLGPIPNVQAIKSKLYPGTKTFEIVFTGRGKGQAQGQTPGMYGEKQRQALREVGTANRVDFTTHSTVGVMGLAGMDQQGNFSKAAKNDSLQEVKRAIEFAADVGRGGPVVVHTGEFTRPIVDAEWNQMEDDKYKNKFTMFEDEEGRTSYKVVDTRTGRLMVEAIKNKKVSRPVWKRYEEGDEYWKEEGGKEYKDENGQTVKRGDYIDYFGNKIDAAQRMPVFDPENSRFKTKQMDWDDLSEEADELTQRARDEFNNWDNLSSKQKEESIWRERIKEAKQRGMKAKDIKIRPEEAYIIATMETNAAHSRGWAFSYGGDFDDQVDQMKKLRKARKVYEKIEEATDEDEKWKLMEKARSDFGGLVPSDAKLPTEIIDISIKQIRNRMEQAREAAASQWSQAEEAMENIRYIESADTYAKREADDAYANLGINAMRQSMKLEEQGKLVKPIRVAMENLFPEQYGSHPEEMIQLVKGSRKRMAELLQQKYRMSKEEAEKRATDHLTATFDTGHINMWRKYWKGDPDKSIAQNDKEFDEWAVDKVRKMAKAKIIGHVHLDDNYGYHDDHLAPGEGNTPIKAMVKALREEGYDGELIVEPGADYTTDVTGFHSVMKTWKHFGSPAYGSVSGMQGSGKTWGQVGYGWFGQTQPAYFSFGGYSPSEDWTLWSGVQLE